MMQQNSVRQSAPVSGLQVRPFVKKKNSQDLN